ncbi:MAG: hypothetical protein SPL13_04710 [Clostridia bacterium]|nr:hypothetical protein [Clostridia bacterium]
MFKLIKRINKKLYKINPLFRKIVRFFMKTKVYGGVHNTTYLSHCKIIVDKGNEVIIDPADWTIKNLEITVKGKNNRIVIGENFVNNGFLKISVNGNDNVVEFGEFNRVIESEFYLNVNGNHCKVSAGKNCTFKKTFFSCRENNSKILIGDFLDSQQDFFIDSMEGKTVTIGSRCLIAYNVQIRNTDGHSVLDENGQRINKAKDVILGNNIWVGQDVLFMKGAFVPDNCVVGAKSIVTKKFENSNSIILGQPGCEKKSNIKWDAKRL